MKQRLAPLYVSWECLLQDKNQISIDFVFGKPDVIDAVKSVLSAEIMFFHVLNIGVVQSIHFAIC